MAGAIDTSPGRSIAARIAGLAELVGGDPVLLWRGRTLDTVCQLNIGAAIFLRAELARRSREHWGATLSRIRPASNAG